MANYENKDTEIVLLNDKLIANDLTSSISTDYGVPTIPSHKLFKKAYADLTTADERISNLIEDVISTDLYSLSGKYEATKSAFETSCDAISDLIGSISTDLSNAITSDVKNLDNLQLSASQLSSEVNRLCTEIRDDLTAKYRWLSGETDKLCAAISNDVESKFVHTAGDNIAWLSVANGLSTTTFSANTSGKAIPTDQFTEAVIDETGFKVNAIGEGRTIRLSTVYSTEGIVINGTSLSDHIKNEVRISADEAVNLAKAYTDAEIKKLDVEDIAVEHSFVTTVREEDGKISVQRAALVSSDIPTIEETHVQNLVADLQNLSSNYVKTTDFKTTVIDNDGKFLSAEDFDLTYDSTSHDITLKAGEKTYKFSAIEFIKSKTVDHMSIETDADGNKWLLIYWTADDFIRLNINELVQVYNFENGISSQILPTGGIHVGATDELARTSYANAISSKVDVVNSNLQTEIRRAAASEEELSGMIASEKARAEDAESTIASEIHDEKVRALSSENELQKAITAEQLRAAGVEAELLRKIEVEELRADGAEKTNANAIASERTRAENAESGLQNQINGLAASLETETTARVGADKAVSDKVDAVSSDVIQLNKYATILSGSGTDRGVIATLSNDILSAVDANIRTVKEFNKHITVADPAVESYDSLQAFFQNYNIYDNDLGIKNGTIVDVTFAKDLSSQVRVGDLSICNDEYLLVWEDSKVPYVRLESLTSRNVKVLKTGVSQHEFALEIQNRIANDNYISGEVNRLCTAISDDVVAKYNRLSGEISSLSNEVSAISNDLSSAISSKIWITDLNNDGSILTSGNMDALSVIKITKDDFDRNVGTGTMTMSSNILYVVSSDYIDAYGQQLCNLTMAEDNIPSEAANKHYVDAKDTAIENNVNAISASVEEIKKSFNVDTIDKDPVLSALRRDQNNSDISTVISAVMYIFNTLTKV